MSKDRVEIDHPIAGERRRGSGGTKSASELLAGASAALDKVKELNEEEKIIKAPQKSLPELKDLVFFGKIREKITLGEYTFELTTLNNKQQKALVSKLVSLKTNDEKLLNIKSFTLAESLTTINGINMEEFYNVESELSAFDKKLEIINNMQSSVVEKLFDKYEAINKQATDLLSSGEVKEEIKK